MKALAAIVTVLCIQQVTLMPVNLDNPEARRKFAEAYLFRFGHVEVHPPLADDVYKQGLISFQQEAGLPQTGILDDATFAVMQLKRCGLGKKQMSAKGGGSGGGGGGKGSGGGGKGSGGGGKDPPNSLPKWNKNDLTYKRTSGTPDLEDSVVDGVFADAMKLWQDAANLRITSTTTDPDIITLFAVRSHGDSASFDGQFGVLAHAFLPTSTELPGDAHFDDDELWSMVNKTDAIQLSWTATHEFGHSLGLLHSSVPNAIMYPYYTGFKSSVTLDNDDISQIQARYGPPVP